MIVLYNMTVLARVHRAGCRARGGRARQRAGAGGGRWRSCTFFGVPSTLSASKQVPRRYGLTERFNHVNDQTMFWF